jgi:aminopeptidase N
MVSLTSHEIAHTYFPFFMGINETKYAWMDEGWASFIDFFITNLLHTDEPYRLFGLDELDADLGGWNDLPIMAGAGQARHPAYFHASYSKPAFFYLILRDMWGEERFREIIQEYMRRWNGKHPTPWDFFHTLQDVTGEDLGWLIRPWFFEYGAPDLAIGAVAREGSSYAIEVVRKGRNPVPIEVTVEFEDGTSLVQREPVSVWSEGGATVTLVVPARGEIKSIVLGNWNTPDANPADNRRVFEDRRKG